MKSAKPSQILIVEDVEEMLELLATLVSGIPGLTVSGRAKNGWEARIELGRRRPDLVLLDEILPNESTADLLTEFLDAQVPVILVTAIQNPSHAIPEGVAGRLSKPDWKTLEEGRKRFEPLIFKALGQKRR